MKHSGAFAAPQVSNSIRPFAQQGASKRIMNTTSAQLHMLMNF